ncbi:hypothetical protein [Streptomyces sp. NPDC088812]|uniref:hypothetical protein n=1 Tax=Streptomyces sp. NPDC088812 TaxID=3365905 RepID=UPI00382484A0
MRIRHALATAALGTALAAGTTVVPAAAAAPAVAPPATAVSGSSATPSSDVSATAYTSSTGGYLREDYYGSADPVSWTYNGESLYVYTYDYNSYGNKWYWVRDSENNIGWIYCGNVTAGC